MGKEVPVANKIKTDLHEILDIRHLTDSTFVLRIEKKDLDFEAGQHVCVGPPNGIHTREYSIYSAEQDDCLEILVKEVENGLVSPSLKKVQKGGYVVVEEPVGYFTINKDLPADQKYVFIASGTGISPFHSFVKSKSNLNYTLLHGVKKADEAYDSDVYEKGKYVLCTSQDTKGDYNGRVTSYLKDNKFGTDVHYYLCGNCNMIHDVYDILEEQGVSTDNIHAEVYF
ncbi:ferredoxin--NADP reductase [Carboxylicivirga sp. M1479]|uniref:ferredoxin--NADP reductase n=1 Tax=Carboxylicivirga sp. M1479 TaxID=2594476 RepID=UPI001178A287|nr:FAD-binding oxidoreductase [Carboxylicivirga sp. M1479]TRX70300.1 oxidoreductase [Carboxylicivirga sp. M1479]